MGCAADILEAVAACRGDGNFGEPFLWSAVFVFLLLLATGKLNIFMQETKAIFSTKRQPAAWCWQQL